MLPIRTILHPTDFSDFSADAFHLACSLARDYGARLIVLHVEDVAVPMVGDGIMMPPPVMDLEPARDALRKIRPEDPIISVERYLIEGDPATEILQLARKTNADLIVMGTHGRTGVGRLLMGSVAERVLREAACPVLTVKGQGTLESHPDSISTSTMSQPA